MAKIPAAVRKKILDELKGRSDAGDTLAMDFASRMERAREMGFDVDKVRYHGTNKDLKAFEDSLQGEFEEYGDYIGRGIFTSSSPDTAIRYAERAAKHGGGSPAIYPVFTKMKKPLTINSQKDFDKAIENIEISQELKDYYGQAHGITDDMLRRRTYDDLSPIEQENYMKSQGFDGLIDNTYDQSAVMRPNQIRSINAAFDPAKKDSTDLLADVGAGAFALNSGTIADQLLANAERDKQNQVAQSLAGDSDLAALLAQGGDTQLVRNRTDATVAPWAGKLADTIDSLDRNIDGPANLLVPTGLGDWARKVQYGDETDYWDRLFANPLL